MSDNVNVARVVRKQKLYASVIRACKKCGAPGFWHDTAGVNPGCYAPEKVTKLGQDPVGPVCPNCGADREEKESLGMTGTGVIEQTILDNTHGTAGNFRREIATYPGASSVVATVNGSPSADSMWILAADIAP